MGLGFYKNHLNHNIFLSIVIVIILQHVFFKLIKYSTIILYNI